MKEFKKEQKSFIFKKYNSKIINKIPNPDFLPGLHQKYSLIKL